MLLEQQHIRMISEGSCDTEDSSNDAENSALTSKNKLHFKMHSNKKIYIVILFNKIAVFTWKVV